MMEETLTGLEAARRGFDAAASRLRRLKRGLASPAAEAPRVERWRALRRAVEALGASLESWSPDAFDPMGDGAEPEARSAAAEQRLAQLEMAQMRLDEAREKAISEIERAAEDRRRLRGDAAAPLPPDPRAASALLERLERLRAACERAFDEERRAQREAAEASRLWRWITGTVFPRLEPRLESVDATLTAATLRRLVESLDARWKESHASWAETLGTPGVRDAVERAEKARAAVEADRDRLAQACERLSDAAARRSADLADSITSEHEGRVKAEEESRTWQGLCEAARLDCDKLLAQAETDAAMRQALEAELASRRTEPPAAPSFETPAEPFSAQAPAMPSPFTELAQPAPAEAAPSRAEPVTEVHQRVVPPATAAPMEPDALTEDSWLILLRKLRQPLDAAAVMMRRLKADNLSPQQQGAAVVAAGSIGQAAEIARAAAAYLEAGRADGTVGRVDWACEAALVAWKPALERCGVSVTATIQHNLPEVSVPTSLLELAVHELLGNALEAMPQGGSLFIDAQTDESRRRVKLCVADSGRSLPSDQRKLFAPLAGAKPGHVGLSLAFIRRLARKAGGDISVDRTISGGAAFTLNLPAKL